DSGIRHTQAPEEWEMWPEFFNEFLQVTDIIKESVNFQRGKDPKQALGVGLLGQRGLTIDHGYVRKGPRRIAPIVDIVQALTNYYKWKKIDRAIFRFPADAVPVKFLATARPGEEMDWPEQGYRKISYEEIVAEIITLAQNDPDFVDWIKPSVISYEWDNWQPLLEEVNFERGMDPKRAMGLGLVKVKGDRGVGDYIVRLIKPYEGDDAAPGEEVWEIEYTNDTELEGARGYAYKYPSSHVLSMRGYWGEIDAFINESVNFERGKDPLVALDAGVSKLLKQYSLGSRTVFTPRERSFIFNTLNLPPSEIYQLGFAEEVDYDAWHHKDYTGELDILVANGKVLSRNKINKDVEIILSDTKIGKIAKIIFDGEGAYFFSGKEPAISLELWKVNRDEWESLP
ncbi:MAG TPA: hypothetical protein PKK07_02615, partial [bacterium]|nr:hypothetical protein [bacterium]